MHDPHPPIPLAEKKREEERNGIDLVRNMLLPASLLLAHGRQNEDRMKMENVVTCPLRGGESDSLDIT